MAKIITVSLIPFILSINANVKLKVTISTERQKIPVVPQSGWHALVTLLRLRDRLNPSSKTLTGSDIGPSHFGESP